MADDRADVPTVDYLDAVEEALCFGWIDSFAKRITPIERVQRFSPRRPKSNWTELHKARARRLIALGPMTNAGRATLPDLDAPFVLAADWADQALHEPLRLVTRVARFGERRQFLEQRRLHLGEVEARLTLHARRELWR